MLYSSVDISLSAHCSVTSHHRPEQHQLCSTKEFVIHERGNALSGGDRSSRQTGSNKVTIDSLPLTVSNRAIVSITYSLQEGNKPRLCSNPAFAIRICRILSSNTCSVQSFHVQPSVSCHPVSAALILATELLARLVASETLVQEIIPRSVLWGKKEIFKVVFPFLWILQNLWSNLSSAPNCWFALSHTNTFTAKKTTTFHKCNLNTVYISSASSESLHINGSKP